jgi:2-aminoadipate transaminase
MAATSAYLAGYDLEAHLVGARARYRHKRDLMLATLARVLPEGVTFTRPAGGLFTWLTFPDGFDAAAFMADELLAKDKVAYVPGATFFPVHQQPQHARMSFSGQPDERMVEGLTRLGHRLRSVLASGG